MGSLWRGVLISLLVAVALAACGGGRNEDQVQNPLVSAQRSEREPAGVLSAFAKSAVHQRTSVSIVDSSALFAWAEDAFPTLFPVGPKDQTAANFLYRYYPQTGTYLAVQGATVMVLGPITGNQLLTLGRLDDFTCSVFPEYCLPPVAKVIGNQSGRVGQAVVLNGTQSYDPGGSSLTFLWSMTSKPPGSNATLNSVGSVTPAFIPDVQGIYTVSLVVNDGRRSSTPATLVVSITAANAAPIGDAGPDRSVTVGSSVQLDATGSHDPDGDALTFTWSIGSKPTASQALISQVNAAKSSFTADLAGTYRVSLAVSDGKITTVSTVTIEAVKSNIAPVAVAGNSQGVTTGNFVFLSGSGSYDPNGDVITYLWSMLTRPSGSTASLIAGTSSSPYFTADVAGNYVLSLVVSDGKLSSAASTVTIVASGGTVTPPRTCCKVCSTGKACGDSCISRTSTCHVGSGCAC